MDEAAFGGLEIRIVFDVPAVWRTAWRGMQRSCQFMLSVAILKAALFPRTLLPEFEIVGREIIFHRKWTISF